MNISAVISKIKRNKYISEFFTPRAIRQFVKYLTTGLLSAGLEYSLFILLTEFGHMWYLMANSIAYFSGFCLSFLLNRFWSFKSKDHIGKQLLLYSILFVINLNINNALMYLLTSIAGIPNKISKILVMGAVVLWNFVLYKKIIYKESGGEK